MKILHAGHYKLKRTNRDKRAMIVLLHKILLNSAVRLDRIGTIWTLLDTIVLPIVLPASENVLPNLAIYFTKID